MTKMSGGDAIHDALVALGVEHVFGIVSVHNIPIYDAIARHGKITPISVRHEQAAVHAADAYSRATGKLGVAITSTGPGATNSITGLFEAQFASSRVLMITGQTDTSFYGKGKGFLHEAEKQLLMLRTVTRRAESPRFVEQLGEVVIRVATDICSGRPQPGAIEVPIDLQYAVAEIPIPPVPAEWPRKEPDEASVAAAIEAISGATKRVIWSGGGVIRGEASEPLQRLAEALDAPVFTTTNGRGAIPEDHDLAMGGFVTSPGMRETIAEAEVVIAVGTRFQGGGTANWNFEMPGKLIHLDADAHMIGLNYKADIALHGDAKVGLEAILAGLGNAESGDQAFKAALQSARDETRASMRASIGKDHESIMDSMRAHLPRKGNIVRDATVPAYRWGNTLIPILEPRTSHNSTSAAIGPGLPLAMGAAIGSGQKTALIQGDGGFMMHIGELTTCVQFNIPVIICVFNDGGYGVLRAIEAARFEGRNFGVELQTPDFAATAEAMGMKGVHVRSAEEFDKEFAAAVAFDGPVLLDIDMDSLEPMQGFGARPRAEKAAE